MSSFCCVCWRVSCVAAFLTAKSEDSALATARSEDSARAAAKSDIRRSDSRCRPATCCSCRSCCSICNCWCCVSCRCNLLIPSVSCEVNNSNSSIVCLDAGNILREMVNLAGLLISAGTASIICGSSPKLIRNDLVSSKGSRMVPAGEMSRSFDETRAPQARSSGLPECIRTSPTSMKDGSEPGSILSGPRLMGTRRSKVKVSHTPGRMGQTWEFTSE